MQRGEGDGSYTIKCDFTTNTYTNSKVSDDWNNANVLTKDVAAQGHLGYGYVRSGEDDYDWWTFTVTADGEANITIDHEGTLRISDLRLYYFEYDKDKKIINYWQRTDNNYYIDPGWYSGKLTINNLMPGTYLLRVQRGEGQGGYQLTYTFAANSYTNNKEPDDWNAPGNISYNGSVQKPTVTCTTDADFTDYIRHGCYALSFDRERRTDRVGNSRQAGHGAIGHIPPAPGPFSVPEA